MRIPSGNKDFFRIKDLPDKPPESDVKAGVVALNARSSAPEDAVAHSLAGLEWLRAQSREQLFFKYCSKFEATLEGKISPVAA